MQKPLIYITCAVVIACGGLFAWNSYVDGCDRAVRARDAEKIKSCEGMGAVPQGAAMRARLDNLDDAVERVRDANRALNATRP